MTMVFARSPGRISLAGSGTDLPAWYQRHGGAVVVLSIASGASAQVSARAAGLELVNVGDGVRELIPAERTERRLRHPFLADHSLRLPLAVAWHFGLERARLAVSTGSDVAAGLGSSAASCTALVAAAATFMGRPCSRGEIADVAARIEMTVLRRACGKQDPYASALGGIHLLEFGRDGSVAPTAIEPHPEAVARIGANLMLFSNGVRRTGDRFHAALTRRSAEDDAKTVTALAELKEIAYEVRDAIERGDPVLLGRLLDRSWAVTRRVHPMPPSDVDRALMLARGAGAYGGTPTSPAAAGTILCSVSPARGNEVQAVLSSQGWREVPFAIDRAGAVVSSQDQAEATV